MNKMSSNKDFSNVKWAYIFLMLTISILLLLSIKSYISGSWESYIMDFILLMFVSIPLLIGSMILFTVIMRGDISFLDNITTHVLGVIIAVPLIGAAIYLMISVKDNAEELSFISGIIGVILGYYFGRKGVDEAKEEARNAQYKFSNILKDSEEIEMGADKAIDNLIEFYKGEKEMKAVDIEDVNKEE